MGWESLAVQVAEPAAATRAAATGRLWTEAVPAPAGSPAAGAWRDRELVRPGYPGSGTGFRAVLLRYADGPAELVVLTDRSRGAGPLAAALLAGTAPPPCPAGPDPLPAAGVPAPEWGLGDPGAAPGHRRLPAAPDLPAGPELLAALGLVLAQRAGGTGPDLGGPVRGYLDSVRAADLAPLAGVVHAAPPPVPAGTRLVAYRPFLVPPYPLTVELVDGAPAVWWYAPSHLDASVAALLARQVATAYRRLRRCHPATPLRAVPLLGDADRDRIVRAGTGAAVASAAERIDELVAARAAEAPGRIAVRCGDEQLTYAELVGRADRMAAGLRSAGLPAGARVGVCLDRSAELVVTLLAVLRAGAAYVPMDPRHPADRLAYTARDAGLDLVVTAGTGFPPLPGVRLVRPDQLDGTPDGAPGPAPGAPAYVIYTSGSTGRPKGVVVTHRNVTSLIAATADRFGLGPADRWTLFHSAAFDFSVWEIWGCLATGGRLVVVPYRVSRSPEDFAALLRAEEVTVLSQTPSAFGQLAAVDASDPLPRPPRLVVLGGEPLDTRPLLDWFGRHPEDGCRLVNMYGITETTVHVTAEPLDRRSALTGSRSVGRPLAGWSVRVLDPDGRLLPPGVAGEIHVGGAGVAAGYLDRPDLTAARFGPDPYAGGTLYRSGDRGRLLLDGRLEHLGRLDDQVKIRGHRIELGEVRARLLDAPGVGAAAVVVREAVPGERASARLDGYVVLRPDGGQPEQVRRHAARFLPDYMVPSTVTALPALPLTPNGKVDTARLPEPAAAAGAAGGPSGPVTDPVQAAWETVFGIRVGPQDNFFRLGGNSLLAVRLVAALRERGLPAVSLPELYRNPTPAGMAELVRRPA